MFNPGTPDDSHKVSPARELGLNSAVENIIKQHPKINLVAAGDIYSLGESGSLATVTMSNCSYLPDASDAATLRQIKSVVADYEDEDYNFDDYVNEYGLDVAMQHLKRWADEDVALKEKLADLKQKIGGTSENNLDVVVTFSQKNLDNGCREILLNLKDKKLQPMVREPEIKIIIDHTENYVRIESFSPRLIERGIVGSGLILDAILILCLRNETIEMVWLDRPLLAAEGFYEKYGFMDCGGCWGADSETLLKRLQERSLS